MIDVAAVKAWLRLTDTADDDLLDQVVAGTNAWVSGSVPVVANDPATAWGEDVTLGATMLAARWYRRRNTPSGIEASTDNVVYLPRRDGDVDTLLHLNRPALG